MVEEGGGQVAEEGRVTDWTLLVLFLSRKTKCAHELCVGSIHQISSLCDKFKQKNTRGSEVCVTMTVTESTQCSMEHGGRCNSVH